MPSESETDGFTAVDKGEDYFLERKNMEKRIIMLLGGKAATEVVFGVDDVGAESDIRRAFNIEKRFIDKFCSYGFRGFQVGVHESENSLCYKEEKLISEMENYYKTAKQIIIENRAFLDAIIKNLIKKEIITYSELAEIKKGLTAQ